MVRKWYGLRTLDIIFFPAEIWLHYAYNINIIYNQHK